MHRIFFIIISCIAGLLLGLRNEGLENKELLGWLVAAAIVLAGGLLVQLILEKMEPRRAFGGLICFSLGVITAHFSIELASSSGLFQKGGFGEFILSFIIVYAFTMTGYLRAGKLSISLPSEGQKIEPGLTGGKILDTSVVIDGRILDISKTGFIEGPLIIPRFVLKEMQLIADSSDSMKRIRGRRGLDILNDLRRSKEITIRIVEDDYPDIKEVDSKLVALAENFKAKIMTNDYNLNKVAEFQNIVVLNINDLANSLKPIYLPGEEFEVTVVKKGKDPSQGIGYLDDGTMIVIENGARSISKDVGVTVTSSIQTSAGRMIFCKPKDHR